MEKQTEIKFKYPMLSLKYDKRSKKAVENYIDKINASFKEIDHVDTEIDHEPIFESLDDAKTGDILVFIPSEWWKWQDVVAYTISIYDQSIYDKLFRGV